MGVTSFSGSTSSVSFSFKPTATNSNITALKFNSNNQPKFEHTFVAHDNVDKGWVAENFDKFNNFVASASATVVVGVGAVRFGVAKFGERFVDAGVNVVGWAKSGVYQLFGNDEAAARAEKRATDFISRDLTGEAKEDFYENTILGRAINEKSYVKYDSEIANKIQNVSEKATEIGTEVAASFIPGAGLAVSATIGAVSGMGKSAEKNYQSGNSMKDAVLDIGIDTVTGALEGYSAGAMGNAAISGIKTLNSLGVNGAKALAKEKFSNFSGRVALDTLKQNSGKIIRQSAANTLKDPDFYVDALGSSSEDIASALRGESSWYDAAKAVTINYGISFVSNFAFNYAGGVGSSVFDSANYGHRIDAKRDSYFDNDKITPEILSSADNNYLAHSEDFTGADDYFDSLDRVERNSQYSTWNEELGGYVGKDVRISSDDPGITSPMTDEAKARWWDRARSFDNAGITRANCGTTNASVFDQYVIGSNGNYGTFGRKDDYNFAVFGEMDNSALKNQDIFTGKDNIIENFEKTRGLESSGSSRLINYSFDVDSSGISMHTGKEIGSNSQRLPGGYLPNGDFEFVHQTQKIDIDVAKNTRVEVYDKSKLLYEGSLYKLAEMKRLNYSEYSEILGLL